MNTPPPLPPEIESFLAPHRTVLPLPPAVEARAMARAAATLEWSRPPARRLTPAGSPPWVFAAAACAVVVAGAAAYAAHDWIAAPSAPAALAPAVPASAAPHRRPIRSSAPGPAIAAPAPDVSDVSDVSDVPTTTAPATIAPEAPPRRRVGSRTNAAPLPTTFAELQLLRMARRDVTNGDYADALAIIAEHSRRFRNGGLVEEREALRVKSLAGLGRHEEAQRAAAELQARFPRSVFLPTFERIQGKGKGADR